MVVFVFIKTLKDSVIPMFYIPQDPYNPWYVS